MKIERKSSTAFSTSIFRWFCIFIECFCGSMLLNAFAWKREKWQKRKRAKKKKGEIEKKLRKWNRFHSAICMENAVTRKVFWQTARFAILEEKKNFLHSFKLCIFCIRFVRLNARLYFFPFHFYFVAHFFPFSCFCCYLVTFFFHCCHFYISSTYIFFF